MIYDHLTWSYPNWFHTNMSDWKPKSDWCHLLLLTLLFPPLTCRFIASSTESSQQSHEPMPASLTLWSTRVGESRETWPKDQLFSWSSSSHLVVVLLSWRWGDTFRILHMLHVDATRCCAPPSVAKFFRSLAVRQGRCQPHFSVLDWDSQSCLNLMKWWPNKRCVWFCSWTWTSWLKVLAWLNSTSTKTRKDVNILCRELTYPTLGKGKSSSKVSWDGIC